MFYAILAEDREDSLEQRIKARPEHLERLQRLQHEGRLLLAGPYPAIDAEDPGAAGFVGSLIVAEFPDLESAKAWADKLGLSYAPTIIFYDESGKEIIRVDSVVGFFRLKNVLRYVNTRAYRKQPSYQIWRIEESGRSDH